MAVHVEPTEPPAHAAAPARRGGEMFRALRHRNFRLFWAGAFLSNVGTWMQAVAQAWLVYELTNSPFWLGFDAFLATAPGLVLTLLGGVFADLMDRKRLLLLTQVGAGLTALVLATLQATHVLQWWMILCASFVTGCCMSLAAPSYQAITIDLVGREDLANAIALNSTQFQLSRVLGPVLAGPALRYFGAAGCFYANGFSFAAVVVALMLLQLPASRIAHRPESFWRDLLAGVRYVRQRRRIFMLLLISACVSLFGAPYFSLLPVFARDVLKMGEVGLSLLGGMAGAGAFFGALVITYLGNFRHKGWFVLGGAWAFAVCLVGFALTDSLAVALAFLFAMGFAIVCSVAVTNTLLQQLVSDEMRGRVMSMFILSFIGAMPLGNFLAGTGASHLAYRGLLGAQTTLAIGGVLIALIVGYIGLRNPRLRALH
ncbi:MAG TPA: MFS transporter [Pyrinomonadaceae bacterium]|jgi:MFS family permease